ncbi:MAG TPA: molybdate ABC transporter substrate-binding protein [Nitrospira sp.]|nr:molybdate ABC transporter substrate-binding protein [Nitrospira sp.]
MPGIRILSMAMVAAIAGVAGIAATGEPVQAETLTVAATHSMKAPFEEIIPMFEKEYGVTVQVVYGPSHTLSQQIEKGAAIDVFLPDGIEEVKKLQKKGLTLNGGPRIYAQTSLVLVMSAASPLTSISFRDLPPRRAARMALGDPKTSALGEITAVALRQVDYKSRYHVLHAEHTDDIVSLVESGVADVGIVYRVDAINSGQVRIIDETPAGKPTSVQFGQAVVSTCREESLNAAEQFFSFIMSSRIQKLLVKYGFDSVSSNGS